MGPTFALSEGDLSWGVTAGILISFDYDVNGDSGWWLLVQARNKIKLVDL